MTYHTVERNIRAGKFLRRAVNHKFQQKYQPCTLYTLQAYLRVVRAQCTGAKGINNLVLQSTFLYKCRYNKHNILTDVYILVLHYFRCNWGNYQTDSPLLRSQELYSSKRIRLMRIVSVENNVKLQNSASCHLVSASLLQDATICLGTWKKIHFFSTTMFFLFV